MVLSKRVLENQEFFILAIMFGLPLIYRSQRSKASN